MTSKPALWHAHDKFAEPQHSSMTRRSEKNSGAAPFRAVAEGSWCFASAVSELDSASGKKVCEGRIAGCRHGKGTLGAPTSLSKPGCTGQGCRHGKGTFGVLTSLSKVAGMGQLCEFCNLYVFLALSLEAGRGDLLDCSWPLLDASTSAFAVEAVAGHVTSCRGADCQALALVRARQFLKLWPGL